MFLQKSLLSVGRHINKTSYGSFSTTPRACSLFGNYLQRVKSNVQELTPQELSTQLNDKHTHVIDIRETYEWNTEHIPNAVYTGRGRLELDIEHVVPDVHDNVVVYCAGGIRSLLAAHSLQEIGYKNVYSLQGGIGAWKQSGFPVKAHMSTYQERLEKY